MSETNEAKEPGQVAYEAFVSNFGERSPAWEALTPPTKAEWPRVEHAVLDHYAPRLATLEAETRVLHRKLSETLVEAQAQRAGRVEAEHQRNVLVGRVGREVTAALVAAVPAKVADVLTGAQHIDEAMQKALDDAVTRAEKAERERDDARGALDMLEHERNAARRERDEARAEVARLTKAAEDTEDAVTGRLDAAFKDGASRMQAEIDRLKAKATARGQRSRYECVTPAGTLYLDDPDANGVQFREAVRYAFASLTPRPDAGLAGLAERESSTVALDASPTTPADAHPNGAGGPTRVEVKLPKVERRPPFRDWSDADRAKLVPGASMVWHCLISACEPRTYGTPRRIVVREVCADDHPLSSGYVVIPDGPPDREVNLSGCDPATIEPPATQAEPVRPDAPDLRPGDEVTVVRPGFTRRGRGRVLDAPALFDGVWQVRCAEIDCEEPGRVSTMPVDWIDMASRVRPPQRQPAPDLRKGDTVAHLSGCNVRIEDAPYLGPGGVWWVRCSDAARPVSSLALYLRVRTWQVGEVVPHAPLTVMRDSSTGARAFTASGGINPNLPLAEPWTQTGV